MNEQTEAEKISEEQEERKLESLLKDWEGN